MYKHIHDVEQSVASWAGRSQPRFKPAAPIMSYSHCHLDTYTYIYIYIYMYMYVCIYIYIYICVHM